MLRELERFDAGLFYCLFDTPDRVQHMFWRFREPGPPGQPGRAPRPEMARVIEDQYRRGDAVVGQALEFADDQTLVIALSDHGFGSSAAGVHLNTWLHEQGLLALRDGVEPGEEAGDLLRARRLVADAGLRPRPGRDLPQPPRAARARGSSSRTRPRRSRRRSPAGLTGLVDPERRRRGRPRRSGPARSSISGPFVGEAPDLLVHFAAGYRVSWGPSLGGVAAGPLRGQRQEVERRPHRRPGPGPRASSS